MRGLKDKIGCSLNLILKLIKKGLVKSISSVCFFQINIDNTWKSLSYQLHDTNSKFSGSSLPDHWFTPEKWSLTQVFSL